MQGRIHSQRWNKIIRLVDERGSAKIGEIAQALGVSAATVRRDLADIGSQGLIGRTRGAAVRSDRNAADRTVDESRISDMAEKEMIGRAASGLVGPGETVMIDGGATTRQVASHIDTGNISVVTNSLDVAKELLRKPGTAVIMVGGELRAVSGATMGPTTEKQIRQLCADKAIIGADAISPDNGLTAPDSLAAQMKQAMIERSCKLIVVADNTKIGKVALYKVAPTSAVSTLVTDDKSDETVLDGFRAAGVEVIVAHPELGRQNQ